MIGENDEQLGVMSFGEALSLAEKKELDLAEVSPKANPPVCKILDYGKYRYWQDKQEHKHRVSQKKSEVKTIRLGVRISDHDLKVKSHQAKKFLKKGNKIQIQMGFRGREAMHAELGEKVLNKFKDLLEELAEVEKSPTRKGREMFMILKARD